MAQHTFSIVAVDLSTGEVGSAGASCIDNLLAPGTGGARVVARLHPGKGAINTQAFYLSANQSRASQLFDAGLTPKEVIDSMLFIDAGSQPTLRQYGIADFDGQGWMRSEAYTGIDCSNYKNHITGPGYAIQGNILSGQAVLDSMEAGFLRAQGRPLGERLMEALLAAKKPGADARCLNEGVSSLSAYVMVARYLDTPGNFYLDLNVPFTPYGVEPIDSLQQLYEAWQIATDIDGPMKQEALLEVFPNPGNQYIYLRLSNTHPAAEYNVSIVDLNGRELDQFSCKEGEVKVPTEHLSPGLYFYRLKVGNWVVQSGKFMINE